MTKIPLRSLLRQSAVIALPGWLVLGGLATLGKLEVQDALIAGGVLVLAVGVMIRPFVSEYQALIDYAQALETEEPTEPPVLGYSRMARTLVNAIMRLKQSWEERRLAADATALSKEHILDSLPDPLLTIDERRLVTGANSAARKLFGRELRGRDLATVIRDPKVLAVTDQVLAGKPGKEVQFRLPMPVERTFGGLVEPLPQKSVDDSVVVLLLHDLTTALRAEQMRADFVANSSHELRTPLSSLIGFIETLRGPARDDPEAQDRFLGIMHKQAGRMARLIDDLLSLSRIEMNEHTQPTESVDVESVLLSLTDLLDSFADEHETEINLIAPDDLPPAIGDSEELGTVFQNLIINAIKYGGDAGTVDVSCEVLEHGPAAMRATGPCLQVSVRDYGEGIPKEHIPRLTERFYRVDTARSRELGGTGLGLAIVKHITNRHRGALSIESEVGAGSTFIVCLPVDPSASVRAAGKTPQLRIVSGGSGGS